MKSAQEYKDGIRKMKPLVYALGGRVDQDVYLHVAETHGETENTVRVVLYFQMYLFIL